MSDADRSLPLPPRVKMQLALKAARTLKKKEAAAQAPAQTPLQKMQSAEARRKSDVAACTSTGRFKWKR